MKNLFDDIPEDLTSEVFEKIVDHEGVTIERIVSRGHCSPDSCWYDQPFYEWVTVLQGEAVLEFEGGVRQRLRAGDYLTIAPGVKHRVSWTPPQVETLWLAVHYR